MCIDECRLNLALVAEQGESNGVAEVSGAVCATGVDADASSVQWVSNPTPVRYTLLNVADLTNLHIKLH